MRRAGNHRRAQPGVIEQAPKIPRDGAPDLLRSTVGARVEALVKQGKNLQEVQAAKPTAEFEELWGKPRGGDDFVRFLYYGYAPYKG